MVILYLVYESKKPVRAFRHKQASIAYSTGLSLISDYEIRVISVALLRNQKFEDLVENLFNREGFWDVDEERFVAAYKHGAPSHV